MSYMMKLLSMTWKNIKRDGIHNMILIIFVIAAVFFMNNAMGSLRYCKYLNHFVKDAGLYDSYIYSSYPNKEPYHEVDGEDLSPIAHQYVLDELEQAKDSGKIADYYSICQTGINFAGDSEEPTYVLFADLELLKDLTMPVAKGEWFDSYNEDEQVENLVPVVVGYDKKNQYSIGQTVPIEWADVTGVVIGVLKPNTLFLRSGVGGNGMDLNHATQFADEMMIVAQEVDDEFLEPACMIRLWEDDREDAGAWVLAQLSDVTDTFSFHDLADKAYEDNSEMTEMQGTLSMLTLLVCIVGMSCSNLLSYSRGRRRQTIYFLCGMNSEMGLHLAALEGMIKLYLPAVIGISIFFRYCERQVYEGLYVDGWNIVITALVISCIMAESLIRTLRVSRENAIRYEELR